MLPPDTAVCYMLQNAEWRDEPDGEQKIPVFIFMCQMYVKMNFNTAVWNLYDAETFLQKTRGIRVSAFCLMSVPLQNNL